MVELLTSNGLPVDELRAKYFSGFAAEGAHDFDFVFTLSDAAAHESLPEWPGLLVTAHWSSPDPTLAEGAEWEKEQAFTHHVQAGVSAADLYQPAARGSRSY